MPPNTTAFDQLPDSAFIRQSQLVPDPSAPVLWLCYRLAVLPFGAR